LRGRRVARSTVGRAGRFTAPSRGGPPGPVAVARLGRHGAAGGNPGNAGTRRAERPSALRGNIELLRLAVGDGSSDLSSPVDLGAGGVFAVGARSGTRGGSRRGLPRARPAAVGTTRPGRAHRQVPIRHSGRFAWRL